MIAGNQEPRVGLRVKQVVGPRIIDVAVQCDVMRDRHGDLQRVGLGLMTWQHAMNVVASRRKRDVFAADDGIGVP